MEDHLLSVECPSSLIIGMCCDTTATNTDGVNEAVQILIDSLKVPML